MSLVILCLAMLFTGSLHATSAEEMLSGVKVYGTPIQSVISALGRPAYVCKIPEDDLPSAGVNVYRWLIGTVQMEVSTHYRTADGRIVESDVYAVDVWGPEPKGEIGTTGAGVAVGGTLANLKRAYGASFKYDPSQTTIKWEDGTQLLVEFDSKGRIFHMQLMAAIE